MSKLYFLEPSWLGTGLTNEIFFIVYGIIHCINNKKEHFIINNFRLEPMTYKYCPMSEILDMHDTNILLKKYNIRVHDKNNLTFSIDKVTYGIDNDVHDVTKEVCETFLKGNALSIPIGTKLNNLKGDPKTGEKKELNIYYTLNGKKVVEKYCEYIHKEISIDIDNPINILNWCQIDECYLKNRALFDYFLKNIKFNHRIVKYSENALVYDKNRELKNASNISFKKRNVNVLHLRIERDITGHMLTHNNMTQEEYDVFLQNKYIGLIHKYFSTEDVIILLSYSQDNSVIDFLRNNNYEFYYTKKNIFDGREKHAILDLLVGEKCNNCFIGNWNFEKRQGSAFSYFLNVRNNAKKNIFIDMYDITREEYEYEYEEHSECISNNSEWIEDIVSAWKGHRKFAEWLVKRAKSEVVVELGVDYGYSTFVFANALKNTTGKIYGIDLFLGDEHAGFRQTYTSVMDNIKNHSLTNIEIIVGDFTEVSKTWKKPINILHIDGLHTYDGVKNDFDSWSKYVSEDGTIIFHDVAVEHFEVKQFFRDLKGGHKLYFTHSAGLGIYTKNTELYHLILKNFDNVFDFDTNPL